MKSLAEMMFLQSQGMNPIDKGAQSAIQAAQSSIAMNDMQRRRAEGHAIMQMGQHMFSPQYGRGLRGTLAAISGGIQPATQAYLGAEDAAREENARLLEAHNKQMQQQQLLSMKQQQMNETARYHNASLAQRREIASAKLNQGQGLTKVQHNLYTKDYKNNKEALHKISSIEKDMSTLKQSTSKNVFAPFGSSLGKYPNIAKEEMSKIGSAVAPGKKWVKELNQEYKLRNNLLSKMKLLEPVLERASKGGQPDVSLMNRFEKLKVLFSEDQPLEVLEEKFIDIKKQVERNMLEAETVLKTGNIFADSVDVHENTNQFGFKPTETMSDDEKRAELEELLREYNASQ